MVPMVPVELLPVHVVEGQDHLLLLLRIKCLPLLVVILLLMPTKKLLSVPAAPLSF